MKSSVRLIKVFSPLATLVITLITLPFRASASERLDLFDAQGNHLMFVVFEHGSDGKNLTRSVYMSDSTFVRKVMTTRDAQGRYQKEASLNFNEDTVFTSMYSSNGDTRTMTVHDQFGMDEFGGPVSYSSSGSGGYIFSQKGQEINRMTYEYDNQGHPVKISISDADGKLLYYGTFASVGVIRPEIRQHNDQPRISVAGGNILGARFSLTKPSIVQCELIALNGRHAGALFGGVFPAGSHRKKIRISGTAAGTTRGVYLVVLSIDGEIAASSRLLLMPSGRSGL